MTTALRDAIDHTALGWVKPEIDETLRQARIELEAFAEAPDDASPMATCMGHLHQVQGTLRMLELQAPAMVAGEMEQLAEALRDGATADRDEALAVLMRGVVQLPDYLERLQGGHRDIPIVLLPLINELRAAHGAAALGQDALPSLLDAPTEAELEHARGSLAGRNRALLDTVSAAIKEDLLKVKDALDLHLRGSRDNVQELQPQAEALDRIGDTLGMLGLESARAVVQEQRKIVHGIASGARPPNESDLLDVAGALLYIDHSLDDQVAQLGSAASADEAGGLLAQESRKVMGALTRAAVSNFAEVRNAFVAFVETDWDHAALESVPRLLGEVAGAMRILERPEPADYLEALRRYSQDELVSRRQVPGGRQLDTLADALASMEYFLESMHDPHGQRLDLLEKTRASLEALRYWPLPEARAIEPEAPAVAEPAVEHVEEAAADAVVETVVAEEEAPAVEAAPVTAQVAVGGGAALAVGFESAGDEIDDEIREIFLEEFQDEIGNLDTLLPAWKLAPDDAETLRPIRRVFHTLKGSGRLVGAKVLGEFAWHVENMLNRVLDGSRPASHAVVAFVGQARESLPQLHAALRGEGSVGIDIHAMEAVADRLAAGEDVLLTAAPMAQPAAPHEEAAAPDVAVAAEPEAAAETQAVSVDPVLLEILGTEVGGHLVTVDAWLAQARAGDAAASDALVRAIHTLNGAFAMTEVPSVTAFTAPAEGYVKRLLAARAQADADGVAALGEVAEAVRASTLALQTTPAQVPAFAALAARMAALRDALPEANLPFIDTAPAGNEDADAARVAAEQAEAQRLAAEAAARAEAERVAAEEAEAARLAAEQAEAERLAAEAAARAEAERLAAEEAEAARLAAEEAARVEAERLAAEEAARQEAERLAAEAEAERLAQEEAARVEAERLAAEQAEAERLAAEQAEAARLAAEEAERLEVERLAAEEAEIARRVAEQAEVMRLEAERAVAEETERLEAARLAAESAEHQEAERLAAEAAARAEAERLAAEEAEAARLAAEQAETERLAAEEAARLEAERIAAEQAEAARLAAEQAEAERLAAEEAARLDAERIAAEEAEAARLAAEQQAEAERLAAEEAARREAERQEAERIAAARAEAERQEAERAAVRRAEAERAEAERRAAEAAAAAQAREQAALAALQSAASAAEDPDEPLDTSELDLELVDIFVEEAGDLLDHSDGLLAKLRDTPDDNELVSGLQRDLHTLKGGARMAGMMPAGELGHAMESLLEAVAAQKTEFGADGVPLLERGFDRLHGMITRIAARRAIGMPAGLIEEFSARAEGRAPAVEQAAEQAATPAPRAVPAKKPELKPLSAPMGQDGFGEDEDIGVRAPQEQVRIRADLLDRLVNYAGEVAIYRARLEQQLAAFRSTAQEMEQTNLRLRDQLRRLDSETEAQIIARFQRENDTANEAFDPLELDRFSTLQQLSRALAESAADLQSLHGSMDDLTRQYETLLTQQSRVSSELQEGLMRTRMLPFDSLVPRLRRVIRQAAGETGKQAQLKLEGAQGELDRNVLERMTAPLEHMLRNAIAHGLETPDARRAAGKPEEGSIRVVVRREGSEVVLQIADDGAGLNRDAIRARGIDRGLIKADATLSDAELDQLIMQPGFSTAETVSRLAGRGVGMDVVASEVRQLGGTIDIASRPGQGTTFTLRLPQTLAVTQAVFVKIGETEYAVPIASVRGVGRIAREDMAKAGAGYRYGGEDYALHDLGALVGAAPAKAEGHLQMPLLLVGSGELRAAVAIDQVVGSREIVVKTGGPQLASVPGIFGATIMGDGRVVVILDVAPLVRRQAAAAQVDEGEVHVPGAQRKVPLVMVVDDSVTMRKVTGRVLERHSFEVATAKDGLDALERMADFVPDLMLLDIEMPRMDGYELATAMKADPRLRNVPIVMITSRTGDKHRQRAFEIGVERYLGKPYQEVELMRNVFELLGLEHAGDGTLQ
ncbi:Hpt domain-containing protein [Thermomonas brevis]|uniref:Chemotaxis protein CheA n=1 Tax=Thermomonas brevis TaxID=215691 RepID=A0A7G9QR59_9GAMM|nr:hybrid sensor histidine kinase/response regulator [Thermomonas brevis]QNN45834.1 Hpt domain-containing protein [Thermomonas brevis]